MNEAALWRWLSKRLPPGHYTRIESECSPGLPDVYYAMDCGFKGWIELKASDGGNCPFRDALRPSQRIWIDHAVRRNVRVSVIGSIGSCFGIWHMHPGTVNVFNDFTITELIERAAIFTLRRNITNLQKYF